MSVTSYKDLIVWQRSMELVYVVYEITGSYPREELFGLTSQTRRAAISIPANLAEGHRRGTRKDYLHFVRISYGSAAELETLLEIAIHLTGTTYIKFDKATGLLTEVDKMLNALQYRLSISIP